MAGIKERWSEYSAAALVGAILPALVTLGIFATKADLEGFKAEIYREFMTRRESETRLEKIEKSVDRILELLYQKLGKGRDSEHGP